MGNECLNPQPFNRRCLPYSVLTFYFLHITYPLLNLLKIKSDINQQDLKFVTFILSNLNNFHSLEVVDRVSETQIQVGENSN